MSRKRPDSEAATKASVSKKKIQQFDAANKRLNFYAPLAAVFTAIANVLFFLPFLGIHNTDIDGLEISVKGWSAAICALTGKYTIPEGAYGNMDVFNYFAPSQCKALGILSLAAAVAVIVTLVVLVVAAIRKLRINALGAGLAFVASGLIVGAFVAALSVKKSNILAEYCLNNPKCSIRSYAIIPALFAIIAAVVCFVGAVKYAKAKKLLK